ncbi:hypothetical protein [Streptomyces sp. NPDC001250]|uniref:hypothetical protein n=1 Tax=Streptomyces sp. NPDC001250 TaxID=3154382 RepID=UPI00331E2CFD
MATRTVRTASGLALSADAVVVATGVRPRALPGQAGLAGVHVLRTWDDAVALRADLRGGAWWWSATVCSAPRSPPPRGPWAWTSPSSAPDSYR